MSQAQATFVKSASDASGIPPNGKPQVALFGRSNVGKSSLINALTGQKGLSRASKTPGRTRLINIFDTGAYFLIDLPGYGFAKAAKHEADAFQSLIIEYLDEAPITFALVVIDMRHGPSEQDLAMMESLRGREVPFVVVANKSDKLNRSEQTLELKKLRSQITDVDLVAVSTETKDGISELKTIISSRLHKPTA